MSDLRKTSANFFARMQGQPVQPAKPEESSWYGVLNYLNAQDQAAAMKPEQDMPYRKPMYKPGQHPIPVPSGLDPAIEFQHQLEQRFPRR